VTGELRFEGRAHFPHESRIVLREQLQQRAHRACQNELVKPRAFGALWRRRVAVSLFFQVRRCGFFLGFLHRNLTTLATFYRSPLWPSGWS
jgi:hypothetical protein